MKHIQVCVHVVRTSLYPRLIHILFIRNIYQPAVGCFSPWTHLSQDPDTVSPLVRVSVCSVPSNQRVIFQTDPIQYLFTLLHRHFLTTQTLSSVSLSSSSACLPANLNIQVSSHLYRCDMSYTVTPASLHPKEVKYDKYD